MKKYAAITAAVMMLNLTVSFQPLISANSYINTDDLPTPLSADRNDKEVLAFKKSKPKITATEGYDYYYYSYKEATIEWKPVDNALLYYIYAKPDGAKSFEKIGATFDTEYDVEYSKTTSYCIKAVSFDLNDNKLLSRTSNTVKLKYSEKKKHDYYEEDGDICYEADECVEEAGEGIDGGSYIADNAVIAPSAAVPYIPENTEEYSHSEESGMKSTSSDPVSTFSVDVDTASYTNIRRMINDNESIPADAVRIEEMLNYFDYGYSAPKNGFSIYSEVSDCPWNKDSQLLMLGVQASEPEYTPSTNLVFLVDVSGSMYSDDKLPLVKESINLLAEKMDSHDRLSIVTYSGEERVVLAGANGNQTNTIRELTECMEAYGCTNGESGINAAYELAEKFFIEGANNRIVMATDGDLNVGISDQNELKKLIEKKRESGVYFTVLGFGTGNIKDNKMETLADCGNGSYHYIDCADEARRVLVEEGSQTLFTIANDVKIQAEFNPATVKSYRLIGYDNRRLNNEDFENDAKDAGEVGAGQSVTAVYEIVPATGKGSSLKYQQSTGNTTEYCTVKIRYKDNSGETLTTSRTVGKSAYRSEMSVRMKLAAAVTEFGLYLKNSDHAGSSSPENVLELLDFSSGGYSVIKEAEGFRELVKKFIENEL